MTPWCCQPACTSNINILLLCRFKYLMEIKIDCSRVWGQIRFMSRILCMHILYRIWKNKCDALCVSLKQTPIYTYLMSSELSFSDDCVINGQKKNSSNIHAYTGLFLSLELILCLFLEWQSHCTSICCFMTLSIWSFIHYRETSNSTRISKYFHQTF